MYSLTSRVKKQHSQLWDLTFLLVPVTQCTSILTLNFGNNFVHLCSLFFQSWSRFSSPAVSPTPCRWTVASCRSCGRSLFAQPSLIYWRKAMSTFNLTNQSMQCTEPEVGYIAPRMKLRDEMFVFIDGKWVNEIYCQPPFSSHQKLFSKKT